MPHDKELHVVNVETDKVEDKGKVYVLEIGEKKDHFKAMSHAEAVFCLISIASQAKEPVTLSYMDEGSEIQMFTSEEVDKEVKYLQKQDARIHKYISNAIGCMLKAKELNNE